MIAPYERELAVARDLARRAGIAALRFYRSDTLDVTRKKADEPVTEADFAANEIIVPALRKAFPEDGLLSEETPDNASGGTLFGDADNRLTKSRVWMIDPLDGTQGFIDRTGDFAVQIGLSVDGRPALGVVYKPVKDVLYFAADTRGAWIERTPGATPEPLRVSARDDLRLMRIAVSRSHRSSRMDAVIKQLGIGEEVRSGSVGVKIGLIVEETCDLYVHLSPRAKQWDTCAPEAILTQAGGRLTDLFGEHYRYNTADVHNHNGIVATNSRAHDEVIRRLAPLLAEFGRARV